MKVIRTVRKILDTPMKDTDIMMCADQAKLLNMKVGDKLETIIENGVMTSRKASTPFREKMSVAQRFLAENMRQRRVVFEVYNRSTTTATILRSGGLPKIGVAQCNSADCYSAMIGQAIALARALKKEIPAELLD